MKTERRAFIKTIGMGSFLLTTAPHLASAPIEDLCFHDDDLLSLSSKLLKEWCNTLLQYQIKDKTQSGLFGGILCPSCARIHGRCPEAIYPLMFLAETTKDKRYLNSAIALYDWMETNVSHPNGSWRNDVNISNWDGTTVFMAIAIAESLISFGHLLSNQIKQQWLSRLKKAADFIYTNFHIKYSNINYPISATYALALFGDLFNEERYKTHAKQLAYEVLEYKTPNDNLLFGERGKGNDMVSPKGCYPIDLGYNIEESLPMLTLYGLKTQDSVILDAVAKFLQAHMEFMLPDGAWDNSWGTRNFKWTYWGSRTTDGCQTAYALMADKDARFYKVALQNTKLLKTCTSEGLLQGGPHYNSHEVLPCIHHTFCHAKALTTILSKGLPETLKKESTKLPREIPYGVKVFRDINTWLVSNQNWKGTITGYDKEYSFKNGHPTGGSLTMLWHKHLGPVLASSMNVYQLFEASNMQSDFDPNSISLTTRFQTRDGMYMNISDLKSNIKYNIYEGNIIFTTQSKLVNANQESPEDRAIYCQITYIFSNDSVSILATHDSEKTDYVDFILPIISPSREKYNLVSQTSATVQKAKGILEIKSDKPLKLLPMFPSKNRIFNHVPGMEAIPFAITNNTIEIKIRFI
ncbi:hypothetical protein ACFFU9_09030 [Mariniflexile ostreae]|uniref:Uncharacterized protein n=1 Tax=Mariniflexile ostreae TaxID=1520892 RepID=A0ABV5FBQ6_9FLAO